MAQVATIPDAPRQLPKEAVLAPRRPRPPRRTCSCAACFQSVDALRASRVVVTAQRIHFFCSVKCEAEFLRALGRVGVGHKSGEPVASILPSPEAMQTLGNASLDQENLVPSHWLPADDLSPSPAGSPNAGDETSAPTTAERQPGDAAPSSITSLDAALSFPVTPQNPVVLVVGWVSGALGLAMAMLSPSTTTQTFSASASCLAAASALYLSRGARHYIGYHAWLAVPLGSALAAVAALRSDLHLGSSVPALLALLHAVWVVKALDQLQSVYAELPGGVSRDQFTNAVRWRRGRLGRRRMAGAAPRHAERWSIGHRQLILWSVPVVWIASALAVWTHLQQGWQPTVLAIASVMVAAPLAAWRFAIAAPTFVGLKSAADSGVVFRELYWFEMASKVSVVVLNARATLTQGASRVMRMVSVGSRSRDAIAVAVANAETAAANHPIAVAIRRFAADLQIHTPPQRRSEYHPGRGVVALDEQGESLVVGNRQWLLDHGISIAVADAAAAEFEDQGHKVVFAGLGGRVEAVFVLDDPLCEGARQALQPLFDARVEVALMSGDHHGSLKALASALEITHVKAGLSLDERRAEVARLRESGATVASIGSGGQDNTVMEAADLSLVLGNDPKSPGISVPSGQLGDASAALWIAHATRRSVQWSVIASVGGGVLMMVAALLGFTTPAMAAIGSAVLNLWTLPASNRLAKRIGRMLANTGRSVHNFQPSHRT